MKSPVSSAVATSGRTPPAARAAARLGAVQALYQMDLAATDVGEVLAQFSSRAAGENFEDGQCGAADYAFLREIVDGVVGQQRILDTRLNTYLSGQWLLPRLDSTVRAILRAGAFELLFMERVPSRVVMAEYLAVSDAFFGGDETQFINGVLNSLAREARPVEFSS